MSQINDAAFKALGDQGFTGSLNDRMLLWAIFNGAVADSLNDALLQVWTVQSGTTGVLNDVMLAGMRTFTGLVDGTLNDVELQFWLDGGVFGPPPIPTWISIPSPSNGQVGVPFSYNLAPDLSTVQGVEITVTTGTLPDGLAINGVFISGTPTTEETQANIQLTVTNVSGSDISGSFNIAINAVALAPNWDTTPAPINGKVGNSYLYDLTPHLNTIENVVLTSTGANLPSGLSIEGLFIVGVPTIETTSVGIQFTATNGSGADESETFPLSVESVSAILRIRLDNPVQGGKEVIDLGNEVQNAPIPTDWPVQSVVTDHQSALGGNGVIVPAFNTRYWDDPVYPTGGTVYTDIGAFNAGIAAASPGSVLRLASGFYSTGEIRVPSDRSQLSIVSDIPQGAEVHEKVTCEGNECDIFGFKNSGGHSNGIDNRFAFFETLNFFSSSSSHIFTCNNANSDRMRVCYNTENIGFASQIDIGQFFFISTGSNNPGSRSVKMDHNRISNHFGGRLGASEIMQIGQNANGRYFNALIYANAIIRHLNDDGTYVDVSEGELVSIKSAGNMYIRNLFLDCMSSINTRTGQDNLYYANIVDGGGYDLSGGIHMQFNDLTIACIFMNINPTDNVGRSASQWANGQCDPPNCSDSDNLPGDNAEAIFSTYHLCHKILHFDRGGDGSSNNGAVFGCAASRLSGSADIFSAKNVTNLRTSGDVLEPPSGIVQAGILEEFPEMQIEGGIPRPIDAGNCDQQRTTSGYSPIATVDFLGNPIPATFQNTGAIQPGFDLSEDQKQKIIDESGHEALL